MKDCREKIFRDLRISNLQISSSVRSAPEKVTQPSIARRTWKDRLKKIPIIGIVAWYFYNIIKAPFKIRFLYEEKNRLEDMIVNLRKSIFDTIYEIDGKIEKKINDLNEYVMYILEEIDSYRKLKSELTFLLREPKKYEILNLPKFIAKRENQSVDFYVFFEEVFRGEDIKLRLAKYVPFIKDVNSKLEQKALFLDIGCGKGEFLELLSENGLRVAGVDINPEFIKNLKEQGFDVKLQDGIDYLSSLEENTLLGISAIHVIEHLDFDKLRKLIEISFRKLINGGILILETPNPKCTVALANFYIDFTHQRPCPYELVAFLCEYVGFKDLKIVLSSPVDKAFRTGNPFGDYMDYGIVAYKR